MNTKHTLLVTMIWSLFLVPVFCQAGVMDHMCPCCPDRPCDHEAECFADPCTILVSPHLESHPDRILPPTPPVQPGLVLRDEAPASPVTVAPVPATALPAYRTVIDASLPLIC